MRQPDLTALKPTDVWVLREGEPVPEGAATTRTEIEGVVLAFRPVRKENDDGNEEQIIH